MYGGRDVLQGEGTDEPRPSQFAQQQQHHDPAAYTQKYKFSSEELRVLRECNRESFYFRCLPLGTAMGVGAYYAVRTGYLKPSARWGAGPKMFAASFVGYFLGKLSYQSKCAEKLMQLPNSPIADLLKKQKGKIGFQETLTMEPGFVTAASVGGPAFPDSEYSIQEPGNFTDVGDTRPMTSFDNESSTFTGFDTKYDTTQQMLDDDNLPQKRPQQFSTSYDDLRRQNRDEFDHRLHSPKTTPPPPSPLERERRNTLKTSEPATSRPRTNLYGDIWDDKTQ